MWKLIYILVYVIFIVLLLLSNYQFSQFSIILDTLLSNWVFYVMIFVFGAGIVLSIIDYIDTIDEDKWLRELINSDIKHDQSKLEAHIQERFSVKNVKSVDKYIRKMYLNRSELIDFIALTECSLGFFGTLLGMFCALITKSGDNSNQFISDVAFAITTTIAGFVFYFVLSLLNFLVVRIRKLQLYSITSFYA